MQNFMVIGDVHGCYFTLKKLLENHWNSDKEQLILLGDLVNKGRNSRKVLKYLMDLSIEFPQKVVVLKGNNEVLFLEKYEHAYASKGVKKFNKHGLDKNTTLNWISSLPHFWENDVFFASHAGIPKKHKLPILADDDAILFNRKSLKNIGKTQFLGHIVVENPYYSQKENAWYLDTGAGYGSKLSAVKVQSDGKVIEQISLQVEWEDIKKRHRI